MPKKHHPSQLSGYFGDKTLEVDDGDIRGEEIIAAAKLLRRRKACGSDDLPPEFWKAICNTSSPACRWAVLLRNRVWRHADVPDAWHLAMVTAVFKKGDASKCDNYRPISLLAVSYKIFASVLLHRLRAAGAEARIWATQTGFKSMSGTSDAIFVARRFIEQAWATRDGQLVCLALDWAKAFDGVDPAALVVALQRFGIPNNICRIVQAIYANRKFQVRDSGTVSSVKHQLSGISQGCPLSPFLFSCVMTILLHDAAADMRNNESQPPSAMINELVYADDTLVSAGEDKTRSST